MTTQTHELKTHPMYFRSVACGEKPFEIRKNDRNYRVGDTLVLREFDPRCGYSGEQVTATVTYITCFEQQEGNVVMGIAPTPATEPVRGSADGAIEFKPQEGRRESNQIAELQERVKQHDAWFTANAEKITDLTQQVQVLSDWKAREDEERRQMNEQLEEIVAQAEKRGKARLARQAGDTQDQPAADDAGDEAKWEKVASSAIEVGFDQVKSGAFSWHDFQAQLLPHKVNQVKAAVTKAVELSLVPRIDPDDLKQVRVVAEIIARDYGANDVMDCFGTSSDILTALAGLNGGER